MPDTSGKYGPTECDCTTHDRATRLTQPDREASFAEDSPGEEPMTPFSNLATRLRLPSAAVVFLVALLIPVLASAERLVLFLTDAESGDFVEGAQVEIESGGETQRVYSSFAGTVDVEVAGSDASVRIDHLAYETQSLRIEAREPRTVEMERIAVPGDEFVFFELSFHAQCVYSNVPLQDATITIERSDTANGPVVFTHTVTTDDFGGVELNGLFPGHYHFRVEKEGWLPLDYPESGTLELTEGHSASVGLEPFKNQLAFEVVGFEPRSFNGEVTTLDDVLVEVTGLTLDGEHEAVPPQAKSTEMGMVDWQTLPPIPHEVRFTKLGYDPVTLIVQPEQLNQFTPIQVDLEIIDSRVTFEIDTVLNEEALNRTANIPPRLIGVEGTNTEGVDKQAEVELLDGKLVAVFDQLLPGRYEAQIGLNASAIGDPDSGPINLRRASTGVLADRVRTTVEVTLGGDETVPVDLPIQRPRVSGRLTVLDRNLPEQGFVGVGNSGTATERNRILLPLEQAGVEVHFIAHPSYEHLPTDAREVVTTTDEFGRFSVELLPGRYGITIPGLPEYSGHEIIVTQTNSRDVDPAMNSSRPWPYPAPWPHSNYSADHHGAPMLLWAGEYDLELILHPNTVDVYVYVSPQAADMVGPPGLSELDTNPPIVSTADGSQIATRQPYASQAWRFPALAPGSHTLIAGGGDYLSAGVPFNVPDFGAPGTYPPLDPGDLDFVFPGLIYGAGYILLDWRPPRTDTGPVDFTHPAMIQYDVSTETEDGAPVSGIEIEIDDGTTAQTVATPGSATLEQGASMVIATPGWRSLGRRCIYLSLGQLECHFTVERQMGVLGTVTIGGEAPNAEIPIRVTDRFGRTLERTTTNLDGTYGATVKHMEVYIVIDSPGFEPVRVRRDAGDPDITQDIDLVPLQPPTITRFDIDRYGVFIPGVIHGRDAAGTSFTPRTEELTATFTIEANAPPVQYDIERFEGEAGPTTVSIDDEIDEVWLLDRRLFPDGYRNTDPGNVVALPLNDPFTYVHARALGGKIANRLDGFDPFHVVRVFGAHQPDGTWTGELKLWEMPRGAFDFVAVAITRAGAVRVLEYSTPMGEPPLRGAQLPSWAATVLNVIGAVATYVPVKMFPLTGLAPKGTMIPNSAGLTGSITESDGKLAYKYGIGVEFAKSQASPTEGLLALTSKNIGFELLGALNFELDGNMGMASFDGGGSLKLEYARDKELGTPAIFKRFTSRKPEVSFSPMVATSVKASQALGAEGEPLPEYLFTRTDDGSLATTVKFDISPYLPYLGQIGVVLLTTTAFNVEYKALINNLVSGKFTETFLSFGGSNGMTTTTPGAAPPRQGFLGQDLELPPDQTTLGLGAGGGLEVTLGDFLGGSATVTFSISLMLNPMDVWPLFSKVTASVKFEGKVTAKISALEAEHIWSHEFKVDWQLGTEPYFELQPSHRTTRIVTPPLAAPSEFEGEDTVVDSLFGAGAVAATESGVAWVEAVDERTELRFARRASGGGFGEPLTVADADGISDVVAVDYGTRLAVVWVEVDGAVGDPMAGGTIRYAVSDDGGETFGSTSALDSYDTHPRSLRGASSDGTAVIDWQVPQMHAVDRHATVYGSDASSGTFSSPVTIAEDREVLSSTLSTGDDGPVAMLALPSAVERYLFDGGEWSLLEEDDGEDSGMYVGATAGGAEIVAPKSGGVWWRRGEVDKLISEDVSNSARQIVAVPSGDGHLVAWLDRMAADGVYYAFVDGDGEPTDGPTNATPDSVATFSELHAVSAGDGAELFVRTEFPEHDRLDRITVTPGAEPTGPSFTEDPGAPDGGDDSEGPDDDGDSGGCCATVRPAQGTHAMLLLLLAFVVAALWRRRASI